MVLLINIELDVNTKYTRGVPKVNYNVTVFHLCKCGIGATNTLIVTKTTLQNMIYSALCKNKR